MKFLILYFFIAASLFAQSKIELLASSFEKGYRMPVISPDGKYVAFGGNNNTGIYLIKFDGSELNQISGKASAGWNMQWAPSSDKIASRVNFWDASMRERETAVVIFSLTGEETIASGKKDEIGMPFWNSSNLYWLDGSGNLSSLNEENLDEEIIYSADNKLIKKSSGEQSVLKQFENQILFSRLSPDKSKIAISILGNGIFVVDLSNGQTYDFGTGEYPNWVSNDTLVLMEVEDDGHSIINSEVYLYNFDGKLISNLTENFDKPALYPSAGGSKVVFNTLDGEIYKINLAVVR